MAIGTVFFHFINRSNTASSRVLPISGNLQNDIHRLMDQRLLRGNTRFLAELVETQ